MSKPLKWKFFNSVKGPEEDLCNFVNESNIDIVSIAYDDEIYTLFYREVEDGS